MSQATRGGIVALPDPNKEQIANLQGVIQRLQPEIARALPKSMNADRIARIALTLVRQSDIQAIKDGKPENSLAVCDPQSFAGALLTASALGLEPGINGEAYLVPYKRECTLIVGYQGFAKLFWQHPLARYLDAHAVHVNDTFDYAYGRDQYITHKPALGGRGPVVAYWAAAELANGAFRFVVLSPDEVKQLRGGKVGPSGRIADPMLWMERKTAVRQLLKLMPKSVTLDAAMRVDEQRGSVLAQRAVPQAIAEEQPLPELPPVEVSAPAEDSRRVTAADITGQPESAGARLHREMMESMPLASAAAPVDGPAAEEAPAAPAIPRSWMARIHASLADCGVAEADRHATLGAITKRPIGSANDLTPDEAKSVIDVLARCAQNSDPAMALDVALAEIREGA